MGWDNVGCSETKWQTICWSDSEPPLKWKTEILEKNLVIVARQIDYTFRQLWGKAILGGMHPIGQTLNHDKIERQSI